MTHYLVRLKGMLCTSQGDLEWDILCFCLCKMYKPFKMMDLRVYPMFFTLHRQQYFGRFCYSVITLMPALTTEAFRIPRGEARNTGQRITNFK